jgi:hypothetical protein
MSAGGNILKFKNAGTGFVLLLLAITVFIPAAQAQKDMSSLIDKGQKAISNGEYQAALELFQQVVQELQSRLSASIEQFLPGALSGWEAGEIESQSWAGASQEGTHNMTNLTRVYTRKSDGASCRINITNWPMMIQGLKQSLTMYKQMPQLLTADPDKQMSIEEKNDWLLMTMLDKSSQDAQVNAIHDNFLVTIEFNQPDLAPAEQYLKSMDLAGLSKSGQ